MGSREGPPGVEVRVLGPFEVAVAGRAVHIGSAKQRAVLALLALHAGQLVASDTLCDLVWDAQQPASPAATLQSLISRLRAALSEAHGGRAEVGRDLLRTRDPGWVLDVETAAVDALRFRELTARARQRAGRDDLTGAFSDLVEALALWRGDALVDVVDAGYLAPQATALGEARLDAVEDLADVELAIGRPADALARLERHVNANPLRERGWAQLMVALYRLGRQAEALRAFQQVRSILGEEVGLEPSPLLAETERRILRQDPSLAGPAAPPEGGVPSPSGAGAPDAGGEFADYRVVVVEDHDFQRRTVVQLLRNLGVGTVNEAPNGADAVELLQAGPTPDIVVCDIDMPGMDGVEFVARVAERGLANAVVIASGLEANVVRAVKAIGESHGLDVLAALEKPLTARRLGDALRQYTRLQERPARPDFEAIDAVELKEALESGELTAEFECRIDLSTGAVTSFEARGRWQRTDGSAVPPTLLRSTVARTGLGLEFVERLVVQSSSLAAELGRADLHLRSPIRVAVNVAPLPLADVSLAGRLTDMVRAREADPRQFVWVIDEVTLARAPAATVELLTRLRVKGFGLSMSHAGLVASSQQRLARAPLTELALDRRLVTGASDDAKRLAVLESALASAQDARLPVVADGCDTRADFDMLVALGCSEAQGRFVAEPMSADELAAWALAGSGATSTVWGE